MNSGWASDDKKKSWNYRLDLSSVTLEVKTVLNLKNSIVLDIPGLWTVHLHYTERLPEQGAGLGHKQDLPEAKT